MYMNIRIIRQVCIDLFGLVRREIVGYHMNLFAPGLVGDNVRQKCNKLSGSMQLPITVQLQLPITNYQLR